MQNIRHLSLIICSRAKPQCWLHQTSGHRLQELPVQCQVVMTLSVHYDSDICSVAGCHSARCRTSWVVYSIMPQWWHLMVIQYIAASFHLPSVSTANINTVQYPKTTQQYEIPTIPAVVISKVLLPQSNIMAAYVHSYSKLFYDVYPDLPTHSNHKITQFKVLLITAICCRPPQTPAHKVQLLTYHSTF